LELSAVVVRKSIKPTAHAEETGRAAKARVQRNFLFMVTKGKS
jgi:hypothetical protein